MSAPGFTPGPWRINKWSATAVENLAGRGICSTGGYADTISDGAYHVENEANAHLIASAPELYAAGEPLAELVRYFAGQDEELISVTAGELRTLAAALAKARGEA